MQREHKAAGRARTVFAFPHHVRSRSELPAALKTLSWASSGKHKRVVPTRFVSAS